MVQMCHMRFYRGGSMSRVSRCNSCDFHYYLEDAGEKFGYEVVRVGSSRFTFPVYPKKCRCGGRLS